MGGLFYIQRWGLEPYLEEEKADKERQKEEKQRLFEFEMEKYQIEVQRVERENKMAEQDKLQRIAQVWIDTAVGITKAWAIEGSTLLTAWYPPIFTGLMSGVAAAQTAAIGTQNVRKPAPIAPKAPKFHDGGIVGNHGSAGLTAIVGDGVSEAILPLEKKTFDALGSSIGESFRDSQAFKDFCVYFEEAKRNSGFSMQMVEDAARFDARINQEALERRLNTTIYHEENLIVNQQNHNAFNIETAVEAKEDFFTELSVKVANKFKDDLTAGIALDDALKSRSRGVYNAWKDQYVPDPKK